MKIAYISSTFPPYKGGIGNVCFYNARELARLGHKVTVFVPQYDEKVKETPYFKEFRVVYMKPFFKYGNAAFCPQLLWRLKKFDLVHLHFPFFGGAEVVFFWKKFNPRTKLVLHYHMDVVGKGILGLIFKFYNYFTLPKILNRAQKVIVTSLDYAQISNIKNSVKKTPNKFIEIPNGVDVYHFFPKERDKELLTKHKIGEETRIILFVGGLDKAHYFKGVDVLLKAMRGIVYTNDTQINPHKNTNVKLIIVGGGELKQNYVKLAKNLDLEDNIIFAGSVSQEDLPKYYNLSQVVVLPSIDKSEAFGLTLVEAFSCGKPVVASLLPGVRTVVDNGINGLLAKSCDIQDLKKKIIYLLSRPEEAQKFGERGRKKVEEKYDWQKIGRQIEGVYKELKT